MVWEAPSAFDEFYLQVLQMPNVVKYATELSYDLLQALGIVVAVVALIQPLLGLIEREVSVEVGQRRRFNRATA